MREATHDVHKVAHRVAWIVSSPTPYKLPFFEVLTAQSKIDVRFLFLTGDDAQRPWTIELGENIDYRVLPGMAIRTSFRRRSYTRVNPSVIGELRRGKFDYVVICGYNHPTLLLALFYCLLTRTPFILQGESHVRKRRSVLKRLAKRLLLFPLLRRCQAAFATGTLSRKYWEQVGIPADRIYIVANTPDIEFYRRSANAARGQRASIRAELGLKDQTVGIFVGRLDRVKAIDVLLQALELLSENKRPHILLVGDGPLRHQIERQIHERRLPVRLLGFKQQADLPELYAAADFFILPSRHEPWGVVVNEAMACGLPLVLSNQVGAAYDLLQDGENGYLFRSENAEQLADTLGELNRSSRTELRRMGEASGEIVSSWTHERSVQNVLTALDEISM